LAAQNVTIDSLGGLGDGLAETPSGRLHIPFTAPGDRAAVWSKTKDRAELVELLESSPVRTTPACVHFGRCGGCALQHLSQTFIATWKRERVAAALNRAGLTAPVADVISIPARTRRRATLAAKRQRKSVLLGFAERASHQLVDLTECPVLLPALFSIVAPLRAALLSLLDTGESADLAVTVTDSGIDLVLIRQRVLGLADRENMAALAEECDLARISWRPSLAKPTEPVSVRRTPVVRMGVRHVPLPPGGFLQPSAEGERGLVRFVTEALEGSTAPFVDLFCGVGTFALPLASNGAVAAYDGDDALVAALNAVREPQIKAARRDLFREPLSPAELNGFAAAVIDPPRAGAEVQSGALAASAIPRIAYVSCNPVSFARDAALLVAGGYRLEQVTPVDQFSWSPHVELVGKFRRD
jgi:23S rRNA (uracil1939-C5)-methyltransferase